VTEDRDHPVDDLAMYALGTLEAPELARLDAHLAACESCARRLADYRGVVGVLPLALSPTPPPAAAWTAIQTAVRSRQRRVGRWRTVFYAARWPAVAAAFIAVVAWNIALQRELNWYARGPQVEALSRRPGRMVILKGVAAPAANARMFIAADGGHGHMAITGLTRLPKGRTYQVWFIRVQGQPIVGGAFDVDARGRAWVSIEPPANLDDLRAVIVTDEPIQGNTAPTGATLLDGRL
jgi:Anti-sigma-K factor rskA, C-terminal/Putative zinc-finger